MRYAVSVQSKAVEVTSDVLALAPLEYKSLNFLLSSQDPLAAEASHVSLSRLRRALQVSRPAARRAETWGLDAQILLLQRVRRVRDAGFGGDPGGARGPDPADGACPEDWGGPEEGSEEAEEAEEGRLGEQEGE